MTDQENSSHGSRRDRGRSRPWNTRNIALVVAFATFVAVWLGATGLDTHPRPPVALKLVDTGTGSTTTTTDAVTTTTDPTVPPPDAPSGYADQLSSLYGQIYQTATALPTVASTTTMLTPDQFTQKVDAMSPSDLGYVNEALPVASVDRLYTSLQPAASVVTHLSTSMSVHAVSGGSRIVARSQVRHAVAHDTSGTTVPQSLTNIPLTMPTGDPFAGDVGSLTYTASCPTGAPPINSSDTYGEGDIFALQIATDVVSGIYNALSPWAGISTPPEIGFGVASTIIAAVVLGLAVAHDTLSYFQTIANDCASAQLAQIAQNTDNNTYQTYTLLTNVAGTVNEVDANVASLTNLVTNQFDQQLMLDIEQALSQATTAVPIAAMELPGSVGGYLDSNPGSSGPTVESVVSTTIRAMLSTSQPMSAQAQRYLGLAEQALGAGQFKLSFDYYRLAYQAAAS